MVSARLFLIFCLFAPALYADTVTVGTLTDYPPYCFDKENAKPDYEEVIPPGTDSVRLQGYSWDVVRESFQAMDCTIRLIVSPWKRCLHYLETGTIEVLFPASKTPEREAKFSYCDEPVNTVQFVIYIPKAVEFKWDSLESMDGKSIAAMRDWNYGEKWKADGKISKEYVDSIIQTFKILDKNRVFGIAGYDIPFDYTLKQNGISDKYRKLPPFDAEFEYLIGSKSNPSAQKILDLYLQGRKKIEQNGIFSKIKSKWM
ncbi:MAG: transporter substrate-binding domain-containing protein [Candidatus Wallbacteria bacterium]|nr:transporter substrate-binding domain-containing protein [Candidatus Wallbacteria bacterium]